MSLIARTATTALAGAVLAVGLAVAAPANAAPMIRVAPVETAGATQVGYYGNFHGHYNPYGWGHGFGYRHCFWKKKKFWNHYGWYWKRIKVCY